MSTSSVTALENILTELGYEPRRPGVNALLRRIHTAAMRNEKPADVLRSIGAMRVPFSPTNSGKRRDEEDRVAWLLVMGMALFANQRLFNLRQERVEMEDGCSPEQEELEFCTGIPNFASPSAAGKQIIWTVLSRIRSGQFHLPRIPQETEEDEQLSGAA